MQSNCFVQKVSNHSLLNISSQAICMIKKCCWWNKYRANTVLTSHLTDGCWWCIVILMLYIINIYRYSRHFHGTNLRACSSMGFCPYVTCNMTLRSPRTCLLHVHQVQSAFSVSMFPHRRSQNFPNFHYYKQEISIRVLVPLKSL